MTNEQVYNFKSLGHVMFTERYEWFLDDDGELWQASRWKVEDGTTGRRFARWVCPAHMAERWIARIKEFSYQDTLPGL